MVLDKLDVLAFKKDEKDRKPVLIRVHQKFSIYIINFHETSSFQNFCLRKMEFSILLCLMYVPVPHYVNTMTKVQGPKQAIVTRMKKVEHTLLESSCNLRS
jgi:hypothetical protein